MPPLHFFNTLTRTKETFTAPQGRAVRMYNCGPTVYDVQHIGNLSAAVFADTLRRILIANTLEVRQVINFTDFGHLVSDADDGEDKMTKGIKREGLPVSLEGMRMLADKYIKQYLEDIRMLNVTESAITFARASEYIPAQIALIQTIAEKGYAYKTSDGVYFDTSRFPEYGMLGGLRDQKLEEGRVTNTEKIHAADFALWKNNAALGWESPWGRGFPGWHIECSAMARAELGEQIDIHTGGIEHVAIHHNNEIAQSEAATGRKPFSRFWLHRAHIQLDGHKIAKSEGNVVYLHTIVEKGYHPLALRYWFLTAHYRSPSSFSWAALDAAQTALTRLHKAYYARGKDEGDPAETYTERFHERINDDVDTPGALAIVWEAIGDTSLSGHALVQFLEHADAVLGLGLLEKNAALASRAKPKATSLQDLPQDVHAIAVRREEARAQKNWADADELRKEIVAKGYEVVDAQDGVMYIKN